MSEIGNISSLCRCCLAEGEFKSLQLSYTYKKNIEEYSNMLLETYGITLTLPSVDASCAICDECIRELRAAARFKKQVEECELKFLKHFEDETNRKQLNTDTSTNIPEVKVELVDDEFDSKKEVYLREDLDSPHEFSDEIDNDEVPSACDSVQGENPVLPEKASRVPKKKEVRSLLKKKIEKEMSDSKRKYAANNALGRKLKREMDPQYTCRECGAEHSSHAALVTHFGSHNNAYTCDVCADEITGVRKFYVHLTTHEQYKDDAYLNMATENRYVCDICQKRFKTKSCIKHHIYRHLGLIYRQYVCELCGKAYKYTHNLKAHVRTFHEGIKFACDVCGSHLANAKSLKLHKMRHENRRPEQCGYCPKRFFTRNERQRHEENKHTTKIEYGHFQCNICPKEFNNSKSYKRHMSRHDNISRAKCNPDDNKKIYPLKPTPCEICNKVFATVYSYGRHKEAIHLRANNLKTENRNTIRPNADRDFLCTECGRTFTTPKRLENHVNEMHVNPKEKIRCRICTVKINASYFEQHMRTHTVRPYSCEFCTNTYPNERSLLRHKKKQHSTATPEFFDCEICHKTFRNKLSMHKHARKMHNLYRSAERKKTGGNDSEKLATRAIANNSRATPTTPRVKVELEPI